MNPDQFTELKSVISESIDRNVNGKINVLTLKFDDYVKDDMAWKKEYEPYLKGLANVSGAVKILVAVAIAITTFISLYAKFKRLF